MCDDLVMSCPVWLVGRDLGVSIALCSQGSRMGGGESYSSSKAQQRFLIFYLWRIKGNITVVANTDSNIFCPKKIQKSACISDSHPLNVERFCSLRNFVDTKDVSRSLKGERTV